MVCLLLAVIVVTCIVCVSYLKHGVGFVRLLFGDEFIFRFSACICICSYGTRRFGVLIDLRRVMVFSIFQYSCLQFKMCSAKAERGSLFFMYLVCSRNLAFRSRVVWPT